jgi:hypothetical protein
LRLEARIIGVKKGKKEKHSQTLSLRMSMSEVESGQGGVGNGASWAQL